MRWRQARLVYGSPLSRTCHVSSNTMELVDRRPLRTPLRGRTITHSDVVTRHTCPVSVPSVLRRARMSRRVCGVWREGRRGGRRGYMPTGGLAGSRGARLAGSRGARPPKYGGLLPHAAQSMHPEGSYPPPPVCPPPCSLTVLPDPEGPSRASMSPGPTLPSAPCRHAEGLN